MTTMSQPTKKVSLDHETQVRLSFAILDFQNKLAKLSDGSIQAHLAMIEQAIDGMQYHLKETSAYYED